MNRFYSLLALLFVGSASLVAQTDDPFGDVPFRDYYGTMSMSAKVYMGGEMLQDIVPAVYSGSQIRGKGNPSANNPGVYFFTIYGDVTGEPLHFKVFTNGRIIEVDDGMCFTLNGITGSPQNPYTIDLPAPVVTTPTTEGWATTCLPFNAEVPEGVTVWNATGIANGELLMTKVAPDGSPAVGGDLQSPTILPANTPVLLQSEGKTSYEWLSRVADGNVTTTGSIFLGTTEPTAVATGSVLTLGYSNEGNHEIGFWLYTGTEIPANRAYIADFPAGLRGVKFKMDDETLGVSAHEANSMPKAAAIYSLDGRKVTGSASKPGLYITNGRKVVIK